MGVCDRSRVYSDDDACSTASFCTATPSLQWYLAPEYMAAVTVERLRQRVSLVAAGRRRHGKDVARDARTNHNFPWDLTLLWYSMDCAGSRGVMGPYPWTDSLGK